MEEILEFPTCATGPPSLATQVQICRSSVVKGVPASFLLADEPFGLTPRQLCIVLYSKMFT